MIKRGYFGDFGGAFLPEILVATFDELERVYTEARNDPAFWQTYARLMGTCSATASSIPITGAPMSRSIAALPT